MKFLALLGGAANSSAALAQYHVLNKQNSSQLPSLVPLREEKKDIFYIDITDLEEATEYRDLFPAAHYNAEATRRLAAQPNPQDQQLFRAINIIKAANRNKAKYEDAVLILEELYKKDPQSIEVNYQLGYAYSRLKKVGEAEQHFTNVLEKEPDHQFANFELARIYLGGKKYLEAAEFYHKLLDVVKSITQQKQSWFKIMVVEDVVTLVENLQKVEERETALEMVEKVVTMNKDGAINLEKMPEIKTRLSMVLRKEVKDLVREGEYDKARQNYEKFNGQVDLKMSFPKIVNDEFKSLILRHDYKSALEFYTHIRELGITDNGVQYLYGFSLFQNGDTENAIEVLSSLIRTEVEDAELYRTLARCYLKSGMLHDAKDHYELAINKDPKYLPAIYDLAILHISNDPKDYKAAHELLLKAIKALGDKSSERTLTKEENFYADRIVSVVKDIYRNKQFVVAADLSEKLVQLKLDYPNLAFDKSNQVLLIRAEELARKKEYSEAQKVYQALAQVESANHHYHYKEALLLERDGKIEEATKSFQDALIDNPKDGKSHYHLARIYQERHITDLAEMHFSKALEYDPIYFANMAKGSDAYDAKALEAYAIVFEAALSGKPFLEYTPKQLGDLCSEVQRSLLRSFNSAKEGLTGDERIFEMLDNLANQSLVNRQGHLVAASFHFARKDYEKAGKHLDALENNPKNEKFIDYKAGVLAQMMDRDELALKFYKRELANYESHTTTNIFLAQPRVLIKMRRYDEALQLLEPLAEKHDVKSEIEWVNATIKVKGKPQEIERLAGKYPLSAKIQKEWQDVRSSVIQEPERVEVEEQPRTWTSWLTSFLPSSQTQTREVKNLRTNDKPPQNQI